MNKRLSKSNDRIVLGVCGGIAEFIDWPKNTVRLLWVLFTFMGLGILVYLVLGIIMPPPSDPGDFNIDDYRVE